MAAAASAPPPQTPHTIEAARPAGLGGAATPAGDPRLPVAACACHGPPKLQPRFGDERLSQKQASTKASGSKRRPTDTHLHTKARRG